MLIELLATHTGQSKERIERDTDRDFFMSPEQAREYGLVDEVIDSLRTKVSPGET
jgi:ATP-dependent Clp protease protease subunit